MEISSGRPYVDAGELSTFSTNVLDTELGWRRDKEHRKITVLEGEGWQFQFNGNLPFELKYDYKFEIPQGMYHRIIKGKTDLVLKIEKDEKL